MTFECHRSSQPAKIFAKRVRCSVGVSGCVVVKKETDPQHPPTQITAISHHPSGPVAISDHQSKITATSGAVLTTHRKKQPNQHQPSLYKTIKREDRYLSGSHCSCTSLCVCLCFSGHHFRMMKSEPTAPTLTAAWSRHVPTDTKSGVVAGPHRKSSPRKTDGMSRHGLPSIVPCGS